MKTLLKAQSLLLVFLSLLFFAFNNIQKPSWDVPAEYKNMKNPVKVSPTVLEEGKKIYDQHCASCHGVTGKGDGKKSEHLANHPANLTLKVHQSGTEGEYFYKIKVGRNGLHSYKNKLDDEDIWKMIHYINVKF